MEGIAPASAVKADYDWEEEPMHIHSINLVSENVPYSDPALQMHSTRLNGMGQSYCLIQSLHIRATHLKEVFSYYSFLALKIHC